MRVFAGDRRGHRLRELRLARARRVLEQQVPLGEHRREGECDHVVLAEHDRAHVRHEALERLLEPCRLLAGHRHRHRGASQFGVDAETYSAPL